MWRRRHAAMARHSSGLRRPFAFAAGRATRRRSSRPVAAAIACVFEWYAPRVTSGNCYNRKLSNVETDFIRSGRTEHANLIWIGNARLCGRISHSDRVMLMSTHRNGESRLTEYEQEQIEQIAQWKSQPPNPFAELFKQILLQFASLVEKVIPDNLVRSAIEQAYHVATLLDSEASIRRAAGVSELGELRHRPLEECDRLAHRESSIALIMATIEGGATGAGGALTTLVDIPLLFVLSLRTIRRIGHCYGYALDQERNKVLVMNILITATSGSLATRRARIDQLREIEHWVVEETEEDILAEEALALLLQLEVFESVPAVGLVSGALLNLAFVRRVELAARRIFQERWLEDNGKVRNIKPAEVHERHLVEGLRGAVGRAAYSGCYSLGFGAAVPLWLAASVARSLGRASRQSVDHAWARIESARRLPLPAPALA